MGRRVQIAEQYKRVVLPSGRMHTAGETVVLSDAEWARVRSEIVGSVLIDLGVAVHPEEAQSKTVVVGEVSSATRTIEEDDAGQALRLTAAATVTLPVDLPMGFAVELIAIHADGIIVQGDGTSVVRNAGTVTQYGVVSCLVIAEDEWLVTGAVEAA